MCTTFGIHVHQSECKLNDCFFFISLLFCNVICDFPRHVCCTTLRQQRDCAEVYTNQHKPKKNVQLPTDGKKQAFVFAKCHKRVTLSARQPSTAIRASKSHCSVRMSCHTKRIQNTVSSSDKQILKKRKKEKRRLLLYHAKKPQRGTEAMAAATEKLNTHKN